MKNLSRCQEMMTIQREVYYIICTIKIIINLLTLIYQDKQIGIFLKNYFKAKLEEDYGATFFFFIFEKRQKTILNFSLNSLIHQKILNLLNEANDSKFVTRKWNNVNDNSKSNYDATNEITNNT